MLSLTRLLPALLAGGVLCAQDATEPTPIRIGSTGALLRVATESSGAAISRDGGRSWVAVPTPEPVIRWRDRSFDLRSGDDALPTVLKAPSGALQFVQFVTDVLPEYRDVLESLGARIGYYVPNSALMVRMAPGVANAVRELPFVRAVGPVQPGHKLDELIAKALLEQTLTPTRYNIVLFDKAVDEPVLARRVDDVGGDWNLGADGGILVEATLTPTQLVQIASEPTVVFVDLWSAPEFDIDNLRIQAGVNYVEAVAGIDGKGMRGHVLEGVHATHTEFAAIAPYRTAPIAVLSGSSSSHGTNTAGEIYARGANATYKGILPFAQLVYTNYSSVINTNNRYGLTRDLVDPAQPYQVTFQTASWGYARTTQYTTRSAEMDDITFDFDHLWITNSQSNAGGTSIPQNSRPQAWAKNVVGVGGFRHYNNSNPLDDCWCNSGSTGPAADGRIGVTFSAYYDSIGTTSGSTGYTTSFGGTSGATPIVNGLGGAAIQMFTDGLFGYPAVSWRDRLGATPNLTTTRVLLSLGTRQLALNRATRPQQGWGLPNLQDLYDNRDNILILDEEDVLTQGQSRIYVVHVKPGTPEFRASMHHLEDEAAPFANPTRINSLDLKVTAPDGTQYWGNNGLNASLTSSPGGSPNDVDIHENVILENPAPGAWQVEVSAPVIRADSHKETRVVDADFALGVRGIGGGRDRSGTVLDLDSSAPGQLTVSVTGQGGGWVGGLTLMSLSTDRHVSLGNVFGVEADGLTEAVISLPAMEGNVFAFTNTANPALYPNAPYVFPAPVAAVLQGRTLDAVAVFYDASGSIVDVSNVDRVTVQ